MLRMEVLTRGCSLWSIFVGQILGPYIRHGVQYYTVMDSVTDTGRGQNTETNIIIRNTPSTGVQASFEIIIWT